MGMKKLIRSAAVVALMSLVVASCNKQAQGRRKVRLLPTPQMQV